MRYSFFTLLICVGFIASGENITSQAAGTWSTASTWDCTCIPGSDDIVTVEHSVTLAISTTVEQLSFSTEFSPSAGNGQLTISSGTLTVTTGTISFGNNGQSTHALTIASGAALDAAGADIQWLQGATITIDGSLTANNFSVANGNGGAFTVNNGGSAVFNGVISMSSGPHTFTIDGVFQSGGITASGNTTMEITGNGDVDIVGDVNISGGSTIDISGSGEMLVDGNLNASGGGQVNVDTGNLTVTDTITTESAGNVDTSNGGTVTASSCSGVCDGDIVLPIVLLAYEAGVFNHELVLTWTSASELNNDYYTIEKSWDGYDYTEVAQIEGNGTSSELNEYRWKSSNVDPRLTYYRLSQTDYDGTTEILGLRSVSGKVGSKPSSFYPSPVAAGGVLHFTGSAPHAVKIIHESGQIIYETSVNSLELPLPASLSKGVFLIMIDQGHSYQTKRLIIK